MLQYAAVIVAAGFGTRTGKSLPKQFIPINGRPVLEWSLRTIQNHEQFSQILVVVSPGQEEIAADICRTYMNVSIINGGNKRSDSVKNALNYLKSTSPPDYVFIHDAARPGLTLRVLDDLIAALKRSDATAPALPVVDAIKSKDENGNLKTVDRSTLHRIQTPQAFDFKKICEAQTTNSIDFVDDLEAAESVGMSIDLVAGENRMMKITLPEDFELVEHFMKQDSVTPNTPRIGSGFDVHAFETGNCVILCGVEIPHSHKLKGHSDADVAWHALTDALYGALAMGDIGTHFPPTDAKWKGVASNVFLNHAKHLADEKGYVVANVDFTIICEAPKLKPHNEAMRTSTSQILGIPIDCISVKATTTEKLGFTGRKEGIAAQANVLLVPK